MRAPATAICLAACALVGGCSLPPNPVVARDPIPPPSPAAKFSCVTTPPVILNTAISHCRPVEERRIIEQRTIVRAKG